MSQSLSSVYLHIIFSKKQRKNLIDEYGIDLSGLRPADWRAYGWSYLLTIARCTMLLTAAPLELICEEIKNSRERCLLLQ